MIQAMFKVIVGTAKAVLTIFDINGYDRVYGDTVERHEDR